MNDSSQTNYQSLPFIRTIKQVALELKIPAQPKINASTPFLPHQREKKEKTTVLLFLNQADILELERDLFCCTYKKRTQYYIFLKIKKIESPIILESEFSISGFVRSVNVGLNVGALLAGKRTFIVLADPPGIFKFSSKKKCF